MTKSYSRPPLDTFERTRLRRAWGDFVAESDWDHVVTLTTECPRSSSWLSREFERRYVRRLEKSVQGPVRWFRVAEEHGSGQLHLHALLWGTTALDPDCLRNAWPHGRLHVERFDPRRGAAYYFTKTMGSDRDDYDSSARRPPALRVPLVSPSARFAQLPPRGDLPHDFGTIGAERLG
jgi:hypothetical protein